jgi:hypothetical protein
LNARFINLGYAAFLPEETFASVTASLPFYIPYRQARELFERFRPTGLFSASSNPEPGIGIVAGLDHSSHDGSA